MYISTSMTRVFFMFIVENKKIANFDGMNYILTSNFLTYGRVDLTASASLQPIRSRFLQLHGPPPCIHGNLNS